MIKLKIELSGEVVQLTARIPQHDKDLLKKLGKGKEGQGLRILLSSIRHDLEKLVQEQSKTKKVS